MSYNLVALYSFDNQLKKLVKKYPSLKQEYLDLLNLLENDPQQGVPIGKSCFKIRLSIASKGKGKSGGARVITNITVKKSTVYLLSIYDKSDQESISSKDLENLLDSIPE